MSYYIVIKTINGRQYRYRQTTWRDGGRMRTKSEYLGPVDGVARRRRGLTGLLQELVRKDDRCIETEAEASARVAREDIERQKQTRINDLLTAPTIALDAIDEIAAAQNPTGAAAAENNPADKSEGEPSAGSP